MTKKQKAHMDRLREVRGLPPQTRENLMDRCAAARCIIDRGMSNGDRQRAAELSAFMSIFHPEVDDQRVRAMIREQAR